jgi:hypothetical protein
MNDEKMQSVPYTRLVQDRGFVLLVGEGKFSFSLALAALRNGVDHIIPTELEIPRSNLYEFVAAVECDDVTEKVSMCKEIKRLLIGDEILKQLQRVCSRVDVDDELKGNIIKSYVGISKLSVNAEWHVDATKLNEFFYDGSRNDYCANIFFQCPWACPGNTSDLLINFLESAAKFQREGDHLFIGYDSGGFCYAYELPIFIAAAENLGYVHLEDDVHLQKKAQQYGYHHYSRSGQNIDVHLHLKTLCLVKKSDDEVTNESKTSEINLE